MGRVRNKHSREFKLEAVRALGSGQHTASELARRLGVTESHLRDWNMISRTILPLISQDDVLGTGSQSGMGDVL